MKRIEAFENAIEQNVKSLRDCGIIPAMFWAYRHSKEAGNELLDFNETVWEEDIEAIVGTCRANGITEFTISTNQSSLITTLAEFEKYGAKISGLTKVKTRFKNFVTGEQDEVNALIIKLQ